MTERVPKRSLSLPSVKDRKGDETGFAAGERASAGKDVASVVRSVKAHFKNSIIARDGLFVILYRLNEEGGRDWFVRFIHTKGGGVPLLLAAMDYHLSDMVFIETASQLLFSLMHYGGKKQIRVVQKVVKKGGSKLLLNILNFHKAVNAKIVQNICSVICTVATVDQKIGAVSRLSGGLATLLTICKKSNKELIIPASTCMLALVGKCPLNPPAVVKKGAVPLLMDVIQKTLPTRQLPMSVRITCKLLLLLARVEEGASAMVKEGGVMTMFTLLDHPSAGVDLQKVVLDTLRCLADNADGARHFESLGGTKRIVDIVMNSNSEKNGGSLLDITMHLFRFHGVTELPIHQEQEVSFNYPFEEGNTYDSGDITAFTPELGVRRGGRVPYEHEHDTASHVRLFVDPMASPSCPSVLKYTPDDTEPLYTQPPNLLNNLVLHDLKRLMEPEHLVNAVVYDDIDRTIPEELNPRKCVEPVLRFSSRFESGNLKRAIQIYPNEYDLILNTDMNSAYHSQWFYFAVEGMVPGVEYKFNIINLEKASSLFNEGLRPVMFSEKEFTQSGKGWHRIGTDVAYMRNAYKRRPPLPRDVERAMSADKKRFKKKDCPSTDAEKAVLVSSVLRKLENRSQGSCFTLTFKGTFDHEDDMCYIAYSYPYTYSDLQSYLKHLPEQHPNLSEYFTNQVLCKTVSNNNVNLLTITSYKRDDGTPYSQEEIAARKVCFISARVHPGESCASWIVKGLIDKLLDSSNDDSKYLRERLVWKIVPMLNPDGVINGNHRCSLTARDLNREWSNPSQVVSPSIYWLKGLIKHVKLKQGRDVLLFCDIHGHSKHRNFFTYGCNAIKKNAAVTPALVLERVLPRLIKDETSTFSYDSSSFKVQKAKESTGRVVVWKELGVRLSYTIEASMMGSDRLLTKSGRLMPGHFQTSHYMDIGVAFLQGLKPFVCSDSDPSILRLGDVVHQLITELTGCAASTVASRRPPCAPATPDDDEDEDEDEDDDDDDDDDPDEDDVLFQYDG